MNITHSRTSKIISSEISYNGPSFPPSISAYFLKLELNYSKTVHVSFCIKTSFKSYEN